ncbi:unnamed protein product, partial [Agarophyton chilense]
MALARVAVRSVLPALLALHALWATLLPPCAAAPQVPKSAGVVNDSLLISTSDQPSTIPSANDTYLFHTLPTNGGASSLLPLLSPLRAEMSSLLRLVADVDDIVTTYTRNTTDAPLTTCNYQGSSTTWRNEAINFFHHRLPLESASVNVECITDAYDTALQNASREVSRLTSREVSRLTPSDYVADRLFRVVSNYSHKLDTLAPELAKRAAVPDWGDPAEARHSADFRYEDRSQECRHDFVAFAKLKGSWFINTRITNRDPLITLGNGQRFFLDELDGGDPNELSVFPVNLVTRDAGTRPVSEKSYHVWNNNSWVVSNTALEFRSGAAFASQYGNIFSADNLAVNLALERGKHSTELAFDATTTSNIAILALPLAMNVVPVALIADVNTLGMLIYTLLTDVLTAIPLAIKGVEVLLISKRVRHAAVFRITGGNLFNQSTETYKAAELWVAECKPGIDYTTYGIVLLVVALFFMVG